ncbi:MAG: IS1634 family transposase [bacterium]|nr:IS1634 family transposase [bacterium]
MRIKTTKTNSNTNYYVIKDFKINGKRTTKIIEKLGTENDIKLKFNVTDVNSFLKDYINKLNKEDNNSKSTLIKFYDENKLIEFNKQCSFNGGYLFLQDIYYSLKINNICDEITNKYQFKYDLNNILSNLIYSRIIYPSSKLKTLNLCKNFLEQPNFEYQHILRALEVLTKENDFIQSELYKNSLKYSKRNDKILFYDCTNYYFEIEDDDDFRKYGKSKEHRPNPIVGMGLFMDGDGIPLTFSTFPGNQNEQTTLKPLEEKIIKDFNNSKFIICTDAGLSSNSNKKFNNTNNRKYVTTQSLKKLKSFLKDWSLDLSSGWKLSGSDKIYDISKLREDDELIKRHYNSIFYKERWIKENGIEERLIVTYSPKYQEYQKKIREKQINRALSIIEKNPKKIKSNNENDPKRFIQTISTTSNGEVADENHYSIDYEKINDEAKYDGLYAVCTNLEDTVEEIIKINKRRWEIEESFRIMKTEFNARPVYLSREDRIHAHFLICFLSLVIYRYLEKKLNEEFTTTEIIETLRNMNFCQKDNDYIPTYRRNQITDSLHNNFNFRTDYEIITEKNIKKICKLTKK